MRNSKLNNAMLKRIVVIMMAAVMLTSGIGVFAEEPYDGYNYDYWEQPVNTPIAYEPITSVSGSELDTINMVQPSDMAVDEHGNIYICDMGNNRIVVLDNDLELVKIVDGFKADGKEDTFKNPQGVYVTQNGNLFVADTGNNRVLEISSDDKLVTTFTAPQDETLPDNFIFEPLKVNVDYAGRVYVIAKNIFEGMMTFSKSGEYSGYFGTINVTVSAIDQFWRAIATKEQRSKMKLYVPTEFTNMDIDEDGFVYTTDVDYVSTQSIKKFNPSSKNVIRNLNVANNDSLPKNQQKTDLIGDLSWPIRGAYEGRSNLVDVEYRGKGIYSVLDNKRGRIITYDSDGNILYVFGGIGNQLGMSKLPTAIESYGERIYILDSSRGEFIVYNETKYGSLINEAIGMRYDGDEGAAVECWQQVLKMDANCRLANVGIGKSLLAENKNQEAMYYLEKGMDKINYSVAFKRYRTDLLKEWFPLIATVVIVVILGAVGFKIYKRWRNKLEQG